MSFAVTFETIFEIKGARINLKDTVQRMLLAILDKLGKC